MISQPIRRPGDRTPSQRLANCEKLIEQGLAWFRTAGEALAQIRDDRLYRETHETFEAYCRERWGFNDSRARQLIGAAETVTTVTAEGLPAPRNEAVARELGSLRAEPEKLKETWVRVVERHGDAPTAKQTREVVTIRAKELAFDAQLSATPLKSREEPEARDPSTAERPYPYAVSRDKLGVPWPPEESWDEWCDSSPAEKAIMDLFDSPLVLEEVLDKLHAAVKELSSEPSCADLISDLRDLEAATVSVKDRLGGLCYRPAAKIDRRRLEELAGDNHFNLDDVLKGSGQL